MIERVALATRSYLPERRREADRERAVSFDLWGTTTAKSLLDSLKVGFNAVELDRIGTCVHLL